MNYGLAREMYGLQPWCVDMHTLPSLFAILNNIGAGVTLEVPETKYNSVHILETSSEDRLVSRPWQLSNRDEFRGVGVININGPITANGGNSSYGMSDLASMMLDMSRDERIVGFVILANSGGGASSAVEIMIDAINEVKQTKPVEGVVRKGGLAASACYGILTACDHIWVESPMNFVGSIGTMMQFEGRKANTEDNTGKKYIRLYAPASSLKNKGYEEALNNDDYEILLEEILTPINKNFHNQILSNRPQLKDTIFMQGPAVLAKDAVGTLVDGIQSFQVTVNSILENSTSGGTNSNITNPNSKTMTGKEFQQSHPESYNTLRSSILAEERDRVGAWLAHIQTDQEIVLKAIRSGNNITQTQTQELLVKSTAKKELQSLESDSADDFTTDESKPGAQKAENEEVEAFFAGIDKKLNLK